MPLPENAAGASDPPYGFCVGAKGIGGRMIPAHAVLPRVGVTLTTL